MALAATLLALGTWTAPAGECTSLAGIPVGDCETTDAPRARSPAEDSSETLLRLLDDERVTRGLRSLEPDERARRVARSHARRMAAGGRLHHDPRLRTAEGRRALGRTSAIGENVGVGPGPASVHAAFMRSRRHRPNMLDHGYTHVGVAAVRRDGALWVVEVFVTREAARATGAAGRLPAGSREDRDELPGTTATGDALRPAPRVAHASGDRSRSRESAWQGVLFAIVVVLLAAGVSRAFERRDQTARTSA